MKYNGWRRGFALLKSCARFSVPRGRYIRRKAAPYRSLHQGKFRLLAANEQPPTKHATLFTPPLLTVTTDADRSATAAARGEKREVATLDAPCPPVDNLWG